jgi:hypothetical protein
VIGKAAGLQLPNSSIPVQAGVGTVVQNLGETDVEVEHIVGGEAVYGLRQAVSEAVIKFVIVDRKLDG